MPGDLVRKYFGYLFDECGFELSSERNFESFGNWVVVLQSHDCRIRFFQDRGEVFMALGPLWSPMDWEAGPWFDLRVVLAFLTSAADIPWPKFRLGYIEQQLEWLATGFHPYCRQACDLFGANSFQQNREALDEIRDRRSEEFWKRLGKRSSPDDPSC